MIFKKLILKNFKQFEDKQILLAPGINIVYGPNEAGKSTISHALMEGLYSNPETKAAKLLHNIYPWNGNQDLVIELELEDNAKRFVIKKDFKNKKVLFKDLETNRYLETLPEVEVAVARMTGIPKRSIYEATAFVSQNDLAQINTDEDFVDAIQNAVSDSAVDVNVQNTIEQLRNEQKKLRVGIQKLASNPGPIKLAQNRIVELNNQLAFAREGFQKANTAKESGSQSEQKLAEIEAHIQDLTKLVENHKKREEAEAKIAILDKQINSLEAKLVTLNDISRRKRDIEADIAKYDSFKDVDLEQVAMELGQNDQLRVTLSKQLQQYNQGMTAVAEELKNQPQAKINWLVNLSLAGTIIALGAIATILMGSSWPLIFAAIIAVLVAVVLAFVQLQARKQTNAALQEQSNYEKVVEDLKAQLTEANQKVTATLKRFNSSAVSDFYELKARYSTLKETLREATIQMSATLGQGMNLEDIKSQQVKLLTEKKEIEVNALTPEVKASKITPQDYVRYTRELDILNLDRRNLQKQLTTAQVRLEDNSFDAEKVGSLEEQLQLAQDSLHFYERKDKVIELVINGLEEAVKDTAKNAGTQVVEVIEKYLPQITNKRYKNARLNSDLQLEVFADAKNDWINPSESLSRGTVDQIYFLARIAFLKTLLGNKRVPIMLDDPFVTFDDKRKQETRKILEELAKEFQIVLFTHSQEYREWGRLIKLS